MAQGPKAQVEKKVTEPKKAKAAAKLRTLDRKKPYAEIYGSTSARYEQHGIQFDYDGVELDGFADVVIPEEAPTINEDTNEAGLRAEIDRLNGLLAASESKQEEKEAEFEEVQGLLDTANVEIKRLNDRIEELSFPAPAGDKTGVDAQLDAQLGGGAD